MGYRFRFISRWTDPLNPLASHNHRFRNFSLWREKRPRQLSFIEFYYRRCFPANLRNRKQFLVYERPLAPFIPNNARQNNRPVLNALSGIHSGNTRPVSRPNCPFSREQWTAPRRGTPRAGTPQRSVGHNERGSLKNRLEKQLVSTERRVVGV